MQIFIICPWKEAQLHIFPLYYLQIYTTNLSMLAMPSMLASQKLLDIALAD
jgi:hypothetical protein